jgi:saposin
MARVLLCAVALLAIASVAVSSPAKANKGDAVECEACKYLVGLVESMVASNTSEADIEKTLDKICKLIPGYQQVCDALVQQGIPQIISWIEQNETPADICTKNVHFCTSLSASNPEECAYCELLIGAIEAWLDAGANQEAIEADLEKLCALIPGIQSTCDAIVVAGIPQIINWIETYENNTIVCQQIGMCGANKLAKPLRPVRPLIGASEECSSCETLIGAMEHWLAENRTEQAIEWDLENLICPYVSSLQKTCDQIFIVGIPQLIQWINDAENPTVVCQQLGVCPKRFGFKILTQ